MNELSSEPIIDVQHFQKSFNGLVAVSDLTLKIYPGTIVGFLGANGSGKTISLRLLCGLILPDRRSGKGKCLGLDLLTQTKDIQAQIGYMPQKFCLYQNLSVYENLDFIGRIYSLKKRKKRLEEIIELFSLKERRNQLTGTLSGGWQQRVALAVAMLHHPRLLLLDEPTSGIDPQSRIVIWEHIQALVNKGTTVLLSTHLMDEAERCHQLAYMAYGKILTQGTSKEIIKATGLYTWRVTGKNLGAFKALFESSNDTLLIEKGNEIHLSSIYPDILTHIDPAFLALYEVKKIETNLEDAFNFKLRQQGVQ